MFKEILFIVVRTGNDRSVFQLFIKNKQNMVHQYDEIRFSNKKKQNTHTCCAMNVKNIMLSERSQMQKTTYSMIPFRCNVPKNLQKQTERRLAVA